MPRSSEAKKYNQGEPGTPQPATDSGINKKERRDLIVRAYKILESDRGMILSLTRGKQEYAQKIIDMVIDNIMSPKASFDLEGFVNGSSSYRRFMYKNKLIDLNRAKFHVVHGEAEFGEKEERTASSDVNTEKTVSEKQEIDAYLQKVSDSIDRAVAKNSMQSQTAEYAKRIIQSQLAGEENIKIAKELGISPTRVTQIANILKEKFPKYSELWNAIQKKADNTKEIRKKNTERVFKAELETLRLIKIGLEDTETLSREQRAMLEFVTWYLDPNSSEEELDKKLEELGVSKSRHGKEYLKRKISLLAGRPLSFRKYSE